MRLSSFKDVMTLVTFFVGLLMIPLETNWLDCIKPFFLCREFFNNTLYFRNPALKAIIYVCFSIVMFAIEIVLDYER